MALEREGMKAAISGGVLGKIAPGEGPTNALLRALGVLGGSWKATEDTKNTKRDKTTWEVIQPYLARPVRVGCPLPARASRNPSVGLSRVNGSGSRKAGAPVPHRVR